MEQGAKTGVFHESEQVLVANVLRLDELPIEAIMTHRRMCNPLTWNGQKMKFAPIWQIVPIPASLFIGEVGGI